MIENNVNLINNDIFNQIKTNKNESYKEFSHAFSSQFNNSLLYYFNTYKLSAQSQNYNEYLLKKNNSDIVIPTNSEYIQMRTYELFQKFENQIVFDLGAGMFPQDSYRLLNSLGIKQYFGVEPFNYKIGKDGLEKELASFDKNNIIHSPAEYIQTDIRTLLENIPNNSASFLASGIDIFVVNNPQYLDDCFKLILEKLHPQGLFVSFYSDFFNRHSYFAKDYTENIQIEEFERDLIMVTKKSE